MTDNFPTRLLDLPPQTAVVPVRHYSPWVLRKREKAVGIPPRPFAGRMADSNLFSGPGPPVASCTALCLSRRLDEEAAGGSLLCSVVRHFARLEISCPGNSGPSGSCAFKPLIVVASFSWLMEKLCVC